MTELSAALVSRIKLDRVWLFALALPLIIAVFDLAQAIETVSVVSAIVVGRLKARR